MQKVTAAQLAKAMQLVGRIGSLNEAKRDARDTTVTKKLSVTASSMNPDGEILLGFPLTAKTLVELLDAEIQAAHTNLGHLGFVVDD